MHQGPSSVPPSWRLLGPMAVSLLLHLVGIWRGIGWWAAGGWSLPRSFAGPTSPARDAGRGVGGSSWRTSQGDWGSLADSYPVAAALPSGYVTDAGPAPPRDVAHVLQAGCAGEPVATTMADVVSGVVAQVPYWSSSEANAISIGFAPGRVVVESETDAMTQVGWYAEPAITVPPIP